MNNFFGKTKAIFKKKSILFVEANEDGTVGGSYFSLQLLVKCLDRTKYNPIVLLYDDIPYARELYRGICKLIILKKPDVMNLSSSYRLLNHFYVFYRKMRNLFARDIVPFLKFFPILIVNRVDLIHLNNSVNAGSGWIFAAILLRKPIIAHQRGLAVIDDHSKKFIIKFNKIICISQYVNESFKLNNLPNTQVIYNPIDIENYRSKVGKNKIAVRKEFKIDDSSPMIGMVGNFQEWKGQTVLVDAVDSLRRQYPEIVCLLIGALPARNQEDIDYFKRVEALINKKNLHRHIIITGFREDTPDLINALDVQLHCSITPEPFGRVLIEGMSLMKPVIATNIGGPCEIIENGVSGLLILHNDSVVLADSIDQILRDTKLQHKMGTQGLQRVKERFSIEEFSKHIDKLYTEVLLT